MKESYGNIKLSFTVISLNYLCVFRSTSREGRKPTSLSWQEIVWRQGAVDYTSRYVGACNTTTDIKVFMKSLI